MVDPLFNIERGPNSAEDERCRPNKLNDYPSETQESLNIIIIDVSFGAIHLGFPHIFTDFSRWMLQQRCIGRLFNGGNPSIYSRSCQTTALVRSVVRGGMGGDG